MNPPPKETLSKRTPAVRSTEDANPAQDEIRWVDTHCARMDHGGCRLRVGVRGNAIVKVKGHPEGYLNAGYVCPKGLASPEKLNHPKRLRHPLRRAGRRGEGRWERVSWEEALETAAEGLGRARERHGARSVAFCQGMPKGLEHFVLIRLANLFGSPNVVAVQDVCHAPREVSGMHTCGFYPVADLHHSSEWIVLWGSNLTSTNEEGEVCALLFDRLREGARLMVVDPRRTELAQRADLWLPVRPGTDAALALAFLHAIVEEGIYDKDFVEEWTHGFQDLAEAVQAYSPESMAAVTGVEADLARRSARAYASARPAALQWGNPIEQTVHNFHASRALLCLMALCGNLDVPGGNIHPLDPPVQGLGAFVRADLIPSKRKEMIHAHHGTIPRLMTVPPAYFRRAVLEEKPYPVKAAYVQCANPLVTYADSRKTHEALMKLDFTVVADIFMTPTAALADVVLPAATQFEFNDVGHYGLGHGFIVARPKVVDPPGECRPDMAILAELGRRLTPAELWPENPEDLLDQLLKPAGLDYAAFAERGMLKGPDKFRKYLEDGFKTPTGKVELRLSRAEKLGLPPLPAFPGPPDPPRADYPLTLTSSKSPVYLHSSYRWVDRLRKRDPEARTDLHPETAARHGIGEGDRVIVETPRGSIVQRARLTESVPPDTVHAAYGWWLPEAPLDWESSNYNLLTSMEVLGKEFGTPNLKGVRCRIRRGEDFSRDEKPGSPG